MAVKTFCCNGDLIRIAKIITIVEIIINGLMLATGILFAGFDGTALFVIAMACFIIAYFFELVGLYTRVETSLGSARSRPAVRAFLHKILGS